MRTYAALGNAAGNAHPEAFAWALSSIIMPLSPLQCALTRKRACKSFAIRTCKSLDLKSLGMNSYKKQGGGGVPQKWKKGGEFAEKPVAQIAWQRAGAALIVVADDGRGTCGEVARPRRSSP